MTTEAGRGILGSLLKGPGMCRVQVTDRGHLVTGPATARLSRGREGVLLMVRGADRVTAMTIDAVKTRPVDRLLVKVGKIPMKGMAPGKVVMAVEAGGYRRRNRVRVREGILVKAHMAVRAIQPVVRRARKIIHGDIEGDFLPVPLKGHVRVVMAGEAGFTLRTKGAHPAQESDRYKHMIEGTGQHLFHGGKHIFGVNS